MGAVLMKFFVFCFFGVSLFLTSGSSANIGEVYDLNGKVQVKAGDANQVAATVGTFLQFGDMIKVRRESIAHLEMVDTSKFQVGPKTTLVLDEFIFDEKKQILTATIKDGVIAYDGKQSAVNSQRKFLMGGYTVTIRGTNFVAEVGKANRIILFKGSLKIEGNGQQKLLAGPLLSITFDEAGIGDPIEITLEDSRKFFSDNNLDHDRHLGEAYTSWLGRVAKSGNWKHTTEKTKLADGVVLVTVRYKKTGEIIKEVVKIRYRDNYYPAIQNSDGSWELSPKGLEEYEQNQNDASQENGSSEQSTLGEA